MYKVRTKPAKWPESNTYRSPLVLLADLEPFLAEISYLAEGPGPRRESARKLRETKTYQRLAAFVAEVAR